MKTEVFCTLQFDGTHYWKNCPIEEVDYLKDNHRHMFHVKAYTIVNHDDRDVEFIQLKHRVQEYLYVAYWDKEKRTHVLGGKSCEMVAEELINKFSLSKCEVNEDNENGAIVYAD
jgi:hypothetical protein